VAGAGNGEEFGGTLDDAEDEGFEQYQYVHTA
jgi:hypothetical protein